MYAIPAETATQGEPFQKENLPGPGKCNSLSFGDSSVAHGADNTAERVHVRCQFAFCQDSRVALDAVALQKLMWTFTSE